jgi:hypothetical protein
MSTEPVRRRRVSPSAREKCIKRARKEVDFLDKWGRWCAIGYFIGGLAILGSGIMFIVLVQRIAQMPGNPQQVQDAMWQGFLLGITFGSIVAFMIFKGVYYMGEGIDYLRGKPASRTLVEYHDILVELIHDRNGQLSGVPDDIPSLQDSMIASESDA